MIVIIASGNSLIVRYRRRLVTLLCHIDNLITLRTTINAPGDQDGLQLSVEMR